MQTTTPAPAFGAETAPPQSPPLARPLSSPPPAPVSRSGTDAANLKVALDAARRRDGEQARRIRAQLADPVAQKIVDWALVDVMGDQMSAAQLRAAIESLDGWPRAEARERALRRAQFGGPDSPGGDQSADVFRQQKLAMIAALRRGDARGAYDAVARHALAPGSVAYADAESLAGWLALKKLHDPVRAEKHFARLDSAVKSPVSRARAAYWRGRVAESTGQEARARRFYEQGAAFPTTFYGQLAAEKAGRRELVLTRDPAPTTQDRETFESAEMTRAIRLLARARERGLVRAFALHDGGLVRTEGELALLVDELRALDEQELSLLAYRRGAQRGLILHDRGYPLVRAPAAPAGVEPAWVLAVTRQESQFDPRVRSPAGARGMMQILPATGRRVARDAGIPWSDDLLWDPQANMRLGSRYLGELSQQFSGSYLMATAGYNAGPLKPPEWISFCGDPRAPGTDPLDFIECIPFGETRDYVMNVMANYQVYRARLNGGRATLTAAEALRVVRQS